MSLIMRLLATLLCGVLLFWPASANTEVFNIASTANLHLCTTPCITLSDFAANQSDNNSDVIGSNITLVLSPGRHILQVNLSISNFNKFAMSSNSSSLPAQVVCEQRTLFSFENCLSVSITSIIFIGCHENNLIRLVRDFKLQNSVFQDLGGGSGSAIALASSTALIHNSRFISSIGENVTQIYLENQQACVSGRAIRALASDLFIVQSLFKRNLGIFGGALFIHRSSVHIESSNFTENEAPEFETGLCGTSHLTTLAGAVFLSESYAEISNCEFSGNLATLGGCITCFHGVLSVNSTSIHNNKAEYGGAVYSAYCTLSMNQVKLARNRGRDDSGGNNGTKAKAGGAIVGYESNITIRDSHLDSNSATFGGALYFQNCSIILEGDITLTNNWDIFGVLYAFNASIAIHDSLLVSNNSASAAKSGPLTLFQSNVVFFGRAIFKDNEADTGGAIYSSETKINVIGDVHIFNNSARNNGGGVYLYQRELECQQGSTFNLTGNRAELKGGAVHAIGTTIKILASTEGIVLTIENNVAQTGGGIFFESNANLYTVKWYGFYSNLVNFIGNSADYGGAIYVDDDTYTAACIRENTACFFQELILFESSTEGISIDFELNQATSRGDNLFGGLLHRCSIVEPIVQGIFFSVNSTSYFRRVTNASSVQQVSSRPVRVCMCINSHPNCFTQQHPSVTVKRGEKFAISLVAVDQLEHPVSTTIQSLLKSNASGLLEGQLTRRVAEECTNLSFNIISPKNSEQLSLYASDGPCRNAESATMTVDVHFLPCTCPIGFQPSDISEVNCTCECHDDIIPYVSRCDTQTQLITRQTQTKAWITSTSFADNTTGYIIYPNCPYDYCKYGQTLSINLNQPNGADAQCAFGRSALLCGSCQSDLSLSLGSSRCVHCPSHWPVLFVLISIAAIIAGIILVAVLLLLNMTVSVGTLNGLIFYANILSVNKSILLPVQESNHFIFANIVISWLNLDIGIDSCYFKGMNAYTKTWLQLAFPAYVFILVATVIVCSSHLSKFSDLIGKRNPVATLATLILLSYTKMLEIAFRVLSTGTINHPDGSQSQVWLPDATVQYFSIKHSLLFVVSVLILLIGLVYTILLFSWQWLLRSPRWGVLKWINNQKLHGFMETYHIPYKPQHRYWTGMLLFARVILYLIAAVNVSNDAQLALTSIMFIIGSIFFLKASIGGRLYRNKIVDAIETAFYFNILAFTTLTWYSINKQIDPYNSVIVHTSIIVALLLLLFVILYHLYMYTPVFSRKISKTTIGKKLNTLLLSMQEPVDSIKLHHCPSDRFNDDFLDTIENANLDHELELTPTHRERGLTHSDVVIHSPMMQRAQITENMDYKKTVSKDETELSNN